MKKIIIFILLFGNLIACSSEAQKDSESYKIGIIGNSNMEFNGHEIVQLSLTDLEKNNNDYDAIFITEDQLSNSLSPKVIPLYDKVTFPIFFIGLKEPLTNFISRNGIKEENLDESNLLAQYIVKENNETIFGEVNGKKSLLERALINSVERYN